MSSELNKTIRFRRSPDGEAGGTASDGSSESPEFELVSTQMLEKILVDEDKKPRDRIRHLAENDEGWLAQDTTSRNFEIVKDDELEKALQSINKDDQPLAVPDGNFEKVNVSNDETSDDLCLVSTQHLRQVFAEEPEDSQKAQPEKPAVESRGFNPYNNA